VAAHVRFTPQKRTSIGAAGNVCFVPEADICTAAKKPLFDHLVAADEANKGQRRAGSMSAASFAGSPDKSLGLTSLFAM
jgi:hypothetical protein